MFAMVKSPSITLPVLHNCLLSTFEANKRLFATFSGLRSQLDSYCREYMALLLIIHNLIYGYNLVGDFSALQCSD